MSEPTKWEWVGEQTYRMSVEGGWLYRHESSVGDGDGGFRIVGETMVFVPTPKGRCLHGEPGLCMPCLTMALQDGLVGCKR